MSVGRWINYQGVHRIWTLHCLGNKVSKEFQVLRELQKKQYPQRIQIQLVGRMRDQ